MPEISSFYGIIISMFFSDHNPPHFHVKYQGYEDQHKDELMANWQKMEKSEPFDKIKPLD